jgi:hypothetical protein
MWTRRQQWEPIFPSLLTLLNLKKKKKRYLVGEKYIAYIKEEF